MCARPEIWSTEYADGIGPEEFARSKRNLVRIADLQRRAAAER
ncbi:hypothetical protein [Kitasatospora sp. NPDC058190]